MRLSGSQSKPSLSNIQVAVTLVLIVAANINSATCNDAHFLPESHFLKQFTPSDCWGHEVDCPKAAAHVDCSEAIDTSFHPADAKRAYQVFFTQGDFGYLGEFVSSLRNYCRPETQFDSSLTCTANLQFCSGVKSSGTSNIAWYHIADHSVLPNYFLLCFYERGLAVERVNGSYRQNQRDEGVGSVCNFSENFVKYVI